AARARSHPWTRAPTPAGRDRAQTRRYPSCRRRKAAHASTTTRRQRRDQPRQRADVTKIDHLRRRVAVAERPTQRIVDGAITSKLRSVVAAISRSYLQWNAAGARDPR